MPPFLGWPLLVPFGDVRSCSTFGLHFRDQITELFTAFGDNPLHGVRNAEATFDESLRYGSQDRPSHREQHRRSQSDAHANQHGGSPLGKQTVKRRHMPPPVIG